MTDSELRGVHHPKCNGLCHDGWHYLVGEEPGDFHRRQQLRRLELKESAPLSCCGSTGGHLPTCETLAKTSQ